MRLPYGISPCLSEQAYRPDYTSDRLTASYFFNNIRVLLQSNPYISIAPGPVPTMLLGMYLVYYDQ